MTRVNRVAALFALAGLWGCGGDKATTGNQAPVAQAGFDRTVGKRVQVVLDGSASHDPEGYPLSYLWTLTSHPPGSLAAIQSPTSAVAGFSADVEGAYVARLQVSDGQFQALDEVTITSQNVAPVAAAGPDRDGSRGVPLPLSGAASQDPDLDPITFSWTLLQAPAGSTAVLAGAGSVTATLTPDVFGSYVVRLTVSDGALQAQDDVTITVRNHPPVANAGPDLESNDGSTLTLSAAASSDPDQDPLACAWTVSSRPAGSAASLSDPASCAPSVTFDAEGTYLFSLVVSDGEFTSAADAVQVTVHKKVWLLGHSLVDAEYSRALERVVAVGEGPARLYLVDVATGGEQSVDLVLAPTSVSVSPDGLHAAVGHNGWVSYVRLSPAPLAVEKTIATTADVFDVVLAGNGYVYAFPRIDQWETIRCLQISTGAETLSTGMSIYARTRAKLHPGGSAIYGANNGLSPSDIEKYGIGGGTAAYLYDSPYHGDYGMCGDLWISEDGARIFTACGNTFRSTTAQATDMTYAGSLEATARVLWADHSATAGKVLAVPGEPYWPPEPGADQAIRVYGDQFLGLQETTPLPRVGVAGKGYPAHGRFAFFSSDGTRRFVVFDVDAASGLLFPTGAVSF